MKFTTNPHNIMKVGEHT